MYQSDWLLRQIEQLGEVVKRLMSALREHRPADVLVLTEDAVRDLVEVEPLLVDALTGEGLVTMLSAGGELDTFRAHMLAELLVARAEARELLGQHMQASADRERARTLLDALLQQPEDAEVDRVRELLEWLGNGGGGHH